MNSSQEIVPNYFLYQPTIYQSMAIGSLAGAADVAITHPLWSIKVRIQNGEKFTINPAILYRGFLANILSTVPTTTMQICFDYALKKNLSGNVNNTDYGTRISIAYSAGVFSSLISCPTERIMAHQEKYSSHILDAMKNIVKNNSFKSLYRGLYATSGREGIYASSILVVTPTLRKFFQPYVPNPDLNSLAAGVAAGSMAALISQPFDTVKTAQQNPSLKHKITIRQAMQQLYTAHGYRGFFRGSLPRGISVVAGVTIIADIKSRIEKRILKT